MTVVFLLPFGKNTSDFILPARRVSSLQRSLFISTAPFLIHLFNSELLASVQGCSVDIGNVNSCLKIFKKSNTGIVPLRNLYCVSGLLMGVLILRGNGGISGQKAYHSPFSYSATLPILIESQILSGIHSSQRSRDTHTRTSLCIVLVLS